VEPEGGYELSTLEQLRDSALALLPPGRAFSRRLESMVARVIEALCMEPARVHHEARTLRAHISPRRATELAYLQAWEEAAGITSPSGTISERAEAAAQVLLGRRSLTLSAYEAVASAHGYTLTGPLRMDTVFFRAGISAAGDPAPGDGWAFALVADVVGDDDEAQLAALVAAFPKRAHTLVRAQVAE
jgi:uncharacterized protein YmfQ (DUF2313 family)